MNIANKGKGIADWLPAIALAAPLLAAGIWFRCFKLMEPLWLDEAYSAYAAAKGFDFLWQVVPSYETHPPFYYSLLRLWTLAWGNQLASLKALGIVCGLATLPMILLAARELARLLRLDRSRALWLMTAALALAAFSVSLVEMAREVRPYPVLILVYTTAHFAMFRLARRIEEGAGIGNGTFGLYLITLALTLWLHNLGPLYGLAIGLALLALVLRPGLTRRDWLWLVGGHALVAVIYLPALRIMLDQAPTWVSSTWLKFSFVGLSTKLWALYAVPGQPQEGAALLLALLALWALVRIRDGWRVAIALASLAFVPTALSITLSVWIAPVFIMRTMTAVAVPAILIMASGVALQRGLWRWPGLVALLIVASQLVVVDVHARRGGAMQDWYGTVHWLAKRFRPGDMVYAYPNEGALPFDFAVRDLKLDLPSRAIPTPVPSIGVGGWNPTGSRGVVSLPRGRLRSIARSPEAEAVPTIWLLRLGPWAYDKGDVFLEELSHDRTRVGRWRSGPIDIIGLRRTPLPPTGEERTRR
jgi:mannosyltransferase